MVPTAYKWDDGFQDWIPDPAHAINRTSISVRNTPLDCNGEAIILLDHGDIDVTPVISGAPAYYTYTMTASCVKDVSLKRCYHPSFITDPSYPPRLNFFSDNDPCGKDAEPGVLVGPGSIADIDDGVPVALDLHISNHQNVQFTGDAAAPVWFDITTWPQLNLFLSFKYLKDVAQIHSITLIDPEDNINKPYSGATSDLIVICGRGIDNVWRHEWGHRNMLRHRGESQPTYMSLNPGVRTDPKAVMIANPISAIQNEFNRFERTKLE